MFWQDFCDRKVIGLQSRIEHFKNHTTKAYKRKNMDMEIERLGVRPLVVATAEAIRLLGGAAGIFNRCVAANWIRPAIRGGRVNYYRYRDVAALAERLCQELPPRRACQQRWLDEHRQGAKR